MPFNCCKCIVVLTINKSHNWPDRFSTFLQSQNVYVSHFRPFYKRKCLSLGFHILQLVKSLLFHTPEAWKGTFFGQSLPVQDIIGSPTTGIIILGCILQLFLGIMQGRCRVVSGSGKVKYKETVFSWNIYHTAVYSNKLTTSTLPIVFPFLVNISANLCKDIFNWQKFSKK